MRALLARFGHWLVSLSGEVVSDATLAALATDPLVGDVTCPKCRKAIAVHPCPAVTIDGEIARCASCQVILPDGTIRQHTGAWLCAPCKGKIATGL